MKSFSTQHVRRLPAGWKVRTKRVGSHELRIGFPPGRRRKGSGRVLEILHPKRENPRKCLTRGVKNPAELLIFGNPRKTGRLSRGNPSNEQLYEDFHQMPASGTLEYDETQDMPKNSYVLGDLVAIGLADDGRDSDWLALNWKKCSNIAIGGDSKLAAGKNGQLYAVGGDQQLGEADLRSLGAKKSGNWYSIGPAYFIVYNARKADDGGDYDQYTHKFAEEGGRRPSVFYDPKAERILLRGGSYTVEGRGIVN